MRDMINLAERLEARAEAYFFDEMDPDERANAIEAARLDREAAAIIRRDYAELTRAGEVIGAQLFDDRRLSKGRREIMVRLSERLLDLADGHMVPALPVTRYQMSRTPKDVRERFPEDLS